MYGIMKEKDVKLSSIVRALKEEITPKKVEDAIRLSVGHLCGTPRLAQIRHAI